MNNFSECLVVKVEDIEFSEHLLYAGQYDL